MSMPNAPYKRSKRRSTATRAVLINQGLLAKSACDSRSFTVLAFHSSKPDFDYGKLLSDGIAGHYALHLALSVNLRTITGLRMNALAS